MNRLHLLPLEDRLAPAVYTVTTTADDTQTTPAGSLRAAIEAANANPGLDDIEFNIPGVGVHSIAMARSFQRLDGAVRINGYSQPGASRNTLAVGNNAQILIQIDAKGHSYTTFDADFGSDMTGTIVEGLSLVGGAAFDFYLGTVNDITIRGNFLNYNPDGTYNPNTPGTVYFSIGQLPNSGANIHIGGPDPGDRNVMATETGTVLNFIHGVTTGFLFQNNYIGINPSGTAAAVSDGTSGLTLSSGTGGKILDNVFGGNSEPIILSSDNEGFLIQGNKIGTNAAGNSAIPNDRGGMYLYGKNHRVEGNLIAHNTGGPGVDVNIYATGITVTRNSIFSNEGTGIDLNGGSFGIGNNGQQPPTLTSATPDASGLTVAGTVAGFAANKTFTIEVYANQADDREGQTYLGTTTVTTDASGNGSFSATVTVPASGFDFITANATNTATGDTSEFSATRAIGGGSPPPPPPPPPAGGTAPPILVGFPQFAAGLGSGSGSVTLYNPDKSVRYTISPFGNITGGVRTASADFNRDGVADLVVGTGRGVATAVLVLDGQTQAKLFELAPFEAAFTGGVFVAAGDVNGDGVPELFVTPDEGGGPRVRVFNGVGFGQINDFFGIEDPNFRGGARAAVGDLNGDGVGDLVVAAGFGGGPRVAVFNGTGVAQGAQSPVKLFGDLLVFEPTLRNGVFVACGDLTGDGKADLIVGGGPGGGPRVLALSGADLVVSGTRTQVANFFAGDVNNRGGVRLTVKDLDHDARADLVVGAGEGAGSRVIGYLGRKVQADGVPPVEFDFESSSGFNGGVFVG